MEVEAVAAAAVAGSARVLARLAAALRPLPVTILRPDKRLRNSIMGQTLQMCDVW